MALSIRAQHGQPAEGTMYSIAKLLDMSRSTHLFKILGEMVESEILICTVTEHRPGVWKRVYKLNPAHSAVPKKTISLKINGKVEVIQEKLF